jgi:hypothetical protein
MNQDRDRVGRRIVSQIVTIPHDPSADHSRFCASAAI